ncbi:hypothetical protein BTUL_0176g00300 [Botrytis tulipae]|uniref:Uncharacterized protein n=1 Tax=Botrytis tulipae TaxID=87230 RepID=A0A4Z1EF84_9HELO|nr:hypothetical protein BTUL_0176g00300 [Botrytis tulipae]
MPIHRSYSQWLLAIKNRVIRPNPPDSPLDTRDEWNSLVHRPGANHNAPLSIQRPSDCCLMWLTPWVQELQPDHESQVQPPVPPPQPEEQDHTPEPQPQTQGTNQELSQPSQPQVIHEAQSLPLSIGLGEETTAVHPPSNLNNRPTKQIGSYDKNRKIYRSTRSRHIERSTLELT